MKADNKRFDKLAVLLGTKRDSYILLTLWYVRKSSYTWLIIGLIGATITHQETTINWTDPNEITRDLISPLAGLVLSVITRIGANYFALITAIPVMRKREKNLNISYGKGFSNILDRSQILRGFRAFRWTHHVRSQAAKHSKIEMVRSGRLNNYLDWLNIILVMVLIIYLF